MHSPKVSIIMPSLNVADFIRESVESVLHQTLRDIEILCVDANSTDGTLEILKEYEAKDERVRVILSDKKSYGYQMNLGLDEAAGEYIGIVETDDWVACNMFESLYDAAVQSHADMVKSNFYKYTTKQGKKSVFFENLSQCSYNEVFPPVTSEALFTVTPSIWSGLYRKAMLTEEGIRFNETPGASYQDASFHLMVCTAAKSCYLLKDAFLHYRSDNDASSVHSPGKVYCICDEMHYYEQFLAERPELRAQVEAHYMFLKYEKYAWNYDRLVPKYQWEFLACMHKEFSEAQSLLKEEYFPHSWWCDLQQIIRAPERYYERTSRAIKRSEYGGSTISFMRKKLRGFFQCCREQGLWYTIKYIFKNYLKA